MDIVCGNAEAEVIQFSFAREIDGVDLSEYAWSVTVKNSGGFSDVYVQGVEGSCLSSTTVGDDSISISWKLGGVALSKAGRTLYQLAGTKDGAVKRFPYRTINVLSYIASDLSDEAEADNSALHETIEYVSEQLPGILEAEEARVAAETARASAETARAAAETARDAAEQARAAAETARASGFAQIDLTVSKTGRETTVTAVNAQGEESTATVLDGKDGAGTAYLLDKIVLLIDNVGLIVAVNYIRHIDRITCGDFLILLQQLNSMPAVIGQVRIFPLQLCHDTVNLVLNGIAVNHCAVVRTGGRLEAITDTPKRNKSEVPEAQRSTQHNLRTFAAILSCHTIDHRLLYQGQNLHQHSRDTNSKHLGKQSTINSDIFIKIEGVKRSGCRSFPVCPCFHPGIPIDCFRNIQG